MRTQSRRLFLRDATAGALLAPSLPFLRAAPVAGEAFWTSVRRRFPFEEAKVPMNAANLCPTPTAVADRVASLTRDIDIDCSFQNRQQFASMLEASRSSVAAHLGVDPDEIALVRNTSEANNIVNNGLALDPGDEIVIWDQNHPTNHVAWTVRAARFQLRLKKVSVPGNPRSSGELIEPFVKAFGPKTRVLAITDVSNASGLRLPVREICDEAHRQNIHVHVDGAQSWGVLHVNLRELACDSYAASAHKWFMGPKEAGVLYVRSDRIAHIWPNVVAPGWGDQVDPQVKGARKFESLGQRDDARLAVLADMAAFHEQLGLKTIEDRVLELANRLKTGCLELGYPLVTPLKPEFSAGVCIVEVPAGKRSDVFERMYSEYGIAGATTGGFRLCPHIYNTVEHIDRALAGLRALRRVI